MGLPMLRLANKAKSSLRTRLPTVLLAAGSSQTTPAPRAEYAGPTDAALGLLNGGEGLSHCTVGARLGGSAAAVERARAAALAGDSRAPTAPHGLGVGVGGCPPLSASTAAVLGVKGRSFHPQGAFPANTKAPGLVGVEGCSTFSTSAVGLGLSGWEGIPFPSGKLQGDGGRVKRASAGAFGDDTRVGVGECPFSFSAGEAGLGLSGAKGSRFAPGLPPQGDGAGVKLAAPRGHGIWGCASPAPHLSVATALGPAGGGGYGMGGASKSVARVMASRTRPSATLVGGYQSHAARGLGFVVRLPQAATTQARTTPRPASRKYTTEGGPEVASGGRKGRRIPSRRATRGLEAKINRLQRTVDILITHSLDHRMEVSREQ